MILLNPLVHYSSTVRIEPVVRTIVVACERCTCSCIEVARDDEEGGGGDGGGDERGGKTHLPAIKVAPSKSS